MQPRKWALRWSNVGGLRVPQWQPDAPFKTAALQDAYLAAVAAVAAESTRAVSRRRSGVVEAAQPSLDDVLKAARTGRRSTGGAAAAGAGAAAGAKRPRPDSDEEAAAEQEEDEEGVNASASGLLMAGAASGAAVDLDDDGAVAGEDVETAAAERSVAASAPGRTSGKRKGKKARFEEVSVVAAAADCAEADASAAAEQAVANSRR